MGMGMKFYEDKDNHLINLELISQVSFDDGLRQSTAQGAHGLTSPTLEQGTPRLTLTMLAGPAVTIMGDHAVRLFDVLRAQK
jgi:hypothetical protein